MENIRTWDDLPLSFKHFKDNVRQTNSNKKLKRRNKKILKRTKNKTSRNKITSTIYTFTTLIHNSQQFTSKTLRIAIPA